MKAAVCHSFGAPLVVEELELASPGPHEVTVRVRACSICHSDLSYLDGAWGGPLPAVFGHEVAGTVEQIGEGVVGVRPGDAVVVTLVRHCGRCYFCGCGRPALCDASFALAERSPLRRNGEEVVQGLRVGGFAEQVVVHSSQAVRLDPEITFTSAAFLACAVATGYGAVVRDAGVRAGTSVVVVGAGGVGLNAVQTASLLGAHPIVAVDVSAEKLPVAKGFGATHALDASRGDVAGAIRELTDGRGADAVLVTVGAVEAVEQAVRLARRGGTVVVVGMPRSGAVAGFDPGGLAHDGKRIVGSKLGSAHPADDLPTLMRLARAGRLRLDELDSGHFTLDEIDDALRHARRADTLRTVIVFEGAS